MAMNPLVQDTASPPIPAVQAWARAYRGGCGPLIDLCQAVPGYPPHPALLEQLAMATADPALARYGPIAGEPGLREAYAEETGVGPDRVLITAGCNQAFFAAMLTIVPRGGGVLLPTPWYFNHKMTCDMLGLHVRALPTSTTGFVPDAELAEALMEGVSAVVLVTPNNPSGAVYPAATVEAFAELCARHGAVLVLDETYRDFQPVPVMAPPDAAVRLYSFSKTYAVPGHRLGALTLPGAFVPEAMKVLDCMHICPQRPAQAALAWGVRALGPWRDANRAEMADRARVMRRVMGGLPGWEVVALGAYFAFVRHPWTGLDDWTVVERLACVGGVAVLPGTAFGEVAGFLRISFANIDCAGIERLGLRLGELADRL